jgi:hypothetical protein
MAYLTCGHGIIYPIREPLCYTGVFKKYLYIKRSLEDLGAELILLYLLEWFSLSVPRRKANLIKYYPSLTILEMIFVKKKSNLANLVLVV